MHRRMLAVVALLVVGVPALLGATAARASRRNGRRAAQSPAPTPSPSPVPTTIAGPENRAELEGFLDGLLGGLMAEEHIPGAAVLVVKDGEVLFSKGYGFANLEQQRPVDPEVTLFHVASLSKLVTATAALQLVEAGKLDLHADVNDYLADFTLKEQFDKPVTLANLLTHTAGFDDVLLGTTEPLDAPVVPLGEYLARHLPRRIMPPGEVISYSNHGYALAGYLVERASGQPFNEYVRQHVFEPLDMRHSDFGLPLPLPKDLAVLYAYHNGEFQRLDYDRSLCGPAVDLYTSAADMAHFMVAHLQNGRFGARRILGEETARTMHRQQFTHDPHLLGWTYGFMEGQHNDVRTLEHAGDWRGFGSWIVLVPEANLGLLVTTNCNNHLRFFTTLLNHFFDRYFPRATPVRPPAWRSPDAAPRAALVSGSYVPVRRTRSDFLKLGLLFSEFRVTAEDAGNIALHLPNDALDPVGLLEVDPMLYRNLERGGYVRFHTDAIGRVDRVFVDWLALDKIPWVASPRLHAIAALVCGLLFATTTIGWALAWFFRRMARAPQSSVPRAARRLGFIVSLLNVAFLVGLATVAFDFDPYQLVEGAPPLLVGVCVLPLLSLPLSLGLVFYLLRSLNEVGWTPLAWLHYLLLTLAAGLFDGLVYYWNLLGVGLQWPSGPWF